MKIGWIGTGVMGGPMAGHLLAAGHELAVFTRTEAKAAPLVERGARWASSPAEAALGADVVCAMVGHPADVREVALGPSGAIAAMSPGSIYIDFTTTDPALSIELAEAAASRGLHALDAPVSGGDVGAVNGTLTIMVGGDHDAYKRAAPIFDTLGSLTVLQGGPGCGQHTKCVNQILIAGAMMGMCEAMLYARGAGLNLQAVLTSVGGGGGASWSLANYAPRILQGDYQPGFFVEHFVKDLGIALDHAGRMGLELPALALAQRLYADLAASDGASLGTQALILELARQSNQPWE